MFRIVCDPSSGSTELCLTETARGGSQIFFVCLVGIWQRNFEPAVCVHSTTGWELVPSPSYRAHTPQVQNHTDQAHEKLLWATTSNFSQAQLSIPWWWIAHDPKHVGV